MKVYISSEAGDQIREILNYLDDNWSTKVSDDFLYKLQKSFDVISVMPYSFPRAESFPAIRKCVITRQVSAYYRIDEVRKEVEILAVINNSQNLRL